MFYVVIGCIWAIVLTLLPEMGMTAASCFTTKLLQLFNPKQVYMIGICGGIKGEVDLTDVIVASASWDYGSGKIKPKTTDTDYYELEPSPNQISISASIGSEIRTYKDEFITEIISEWASLHPDNKITPKVHLSPMPSGAAVICDKEVFSQIIRPQHRKCVGLDMETYPNGAFALSRQIYESIVIMNYLIKHKDDKQLIERFYDSIEITCLQIMKEYEKLYSCEVNKSFSELDDYQEKYNEYTNSHGFFKDYWWVRKGCCFSDLAQETDFPKNYMYKETSNAVHMSTYNSFMYMGSNPNEILIGETYDGVEKAGWYSMLCYTMAMDLFRSIINIELDDLISINKELISKIRTK